MNNWLTLQRTMRKFLMFSGALLMVGAPGFLQTAGAQTQIKTTETVIEYISNRPFAQTTGRLEAAIRAAHFMVICNPDYQAMQRMVGRQRLGSKAYYIFRPDLGIPIFDNDYYAAMAVPIKILVTERPDHKTSIRYVQPSSGLANYHGLQSLGQTLDTALKNVVTTATK